MFATCPGDTTPTFSFSPDERIEKAKQYSVEFQNNSTGNESLMSYSGDNDTNIEATLDTTEEIDDTLDESNDSVEEDGDLTVFPWYATNFLLKLIFRSFRNDNGDCIIPVIGLCNDSLALY